MKTILIPTLERLTKVRQELELLISNEHLHSTPVEEDLFYSEIQKLLELHKQLCDNQRNHFA
jgi:hypothetical protein